MKSGLQDRRSADTLFLAKPRDRQETRFIETSGRGVDSSRKSALKQITGFEEYELRNRMIINGGILLSGEERVPLPAINL